jgi:hypothetical protein
MELCFLNLLRDDYKIVLKTNRQMKTNVNLRDKKNKIFVGEFREYFCLFNIRAKLKWFSVTGRCKEIILVFFRRLKNFFLSSPKRNDGFEPTKR